MNVLVLQLAAAVALVFGWCAIDWCRNRRTQIEMARSEMEEFQRASMAIIKDMSVPIDIVEFVGAVGRHLDKPEMARHVVERIRSGDRSERSKSVIVLDGLNAKALENFSKVVVYGTLISAGHHPFFAGRWRGVVISNLTKPAKVVKSPKVVSALKPMFDPREPLWPRSPVAVVGIVDTRKAPEVAPSLVLC